MLKSTHRPAPAPAPPRLPPGWTEHKAPSGHTYYYNAETKKSTYTRPAPTTDLSSHTSPPPLASVDSAITNEQANDLQLQSEPLSYAQWSAPFQQTSPPFQDRTQDRPQDRRFQQRQHHEPQDRPKSKHPIPGCAPWLLIKTRLRRRFVHNPETRESLWRYPQDLVDGVVELDNQERKKAEAKEKGEAEGDAPARVLGDVRKEEDADEQMDEDDDAALLAEADEGTSFSPAPAPAPSYDSDEYEEVEVTDDEDNSDPTTATSRKRQKQASHSPNGSAADASHEFTEADMAAQLAQMGETYDLDPGEYAGDGEYEEGAEGLSMTDQEASTAFQELLADFRINPYKTWDQVIEDGRIVDDARYTYLPTTRTRKEIFAVWSTEQISLQQSQREREARKNPRIPYLAFLQKNATPKLYWPEFKRKFKKEAELRDSKLNDREREKLYREYVRRVTTLSERERKEDLWEVLEGVKVGGGFSGGSCGIEDLPEVVLADLKLYVLKEDVRDRVLKDFARTLPDAEEAASKNEGADREDRDAMKKELRALREREDRVERERKRQQRDLHEGRDRLRQEEKEIRRAMRVGKDGLRENLAGRESVGT
ncbi:MAG: hypothetical protein M1828_003918 [Chrysothrix sp. TS-e1954]|nr:MAG: hypothetical protein M1828_003918 [Chrysothrix sp. TS-e1954]